MSQKAVAAAIGVGYSTLKLIKKRDPAMAAAMETGLDLSQAWWEEQGRINLHNPKFQWTGWIFNMKNRFGWSDRRTEIVEGVVVESIPLEDANAFLERAVNPNGKRVASTKKA